MKRNILIILIILVLGVSLSFFGACKNYCLIFFGSGGDCVYNDYNYDYLGDLESIVPSDDENALTIKNLFGQDVALSENGDIIVVGSPQQESDYSGGVYVFTKTDQVLDDAFDVLIPSSSTFGENNFAGRSVSITNDGSIIAYGVPEMDGEGTNENDRGAVFVFEKDTNGDWLESQKLTASDAENFDKFGSTVRLSGDGSTMLVGCVENINTPTPKYNVYVFKNVSGVWTESYVFDASDFVFSSDALLAISEDGSLIVLSDPYATANNNEKEGVVHVYTSDGAGDYTEQIISLESGVGVNDFNFGNKVDIAGNGEFIFISNSQSSNSGNSAIYVYSLKNTGSGEEWINVSIIPYEVRIRSMSVSSDGKFVVIGGQDIADVYISDLETDLDLGGKYLWVHYQEFTIDFLQDAEPGESVRISSDASTIAIADIRKLSTKNPGTVFIYDRLLENEIE